jgi:hypothetical protein
MNKRKIKRQLKRLRRQQTEMLFHQAETMVAVIGLLEDGGDGDDNDDDAVAEPAKPSKLKVVGDG